MQIASITVVGQFPDGVDLHIRNLEWFLGGTDYHIYIITTPEMCDQFRIDDKNVTFVTKPEPGRDFAANPDTGFINFWRWFPAIVYTQKISPAWFLFMEQDLWFFETFDCFPDRRTVKAFYPENASYHNVMLNDRVLQPHIWEGTHLIHADLVNRAIRSGIKFAHFTESFLDKNREYYEKKFGGKISISMWTRPETMSEFSLYCALEEQVAWEEVEKAVHLRGPELVHRKQPKLYRDCTRETVDAVQRELPQVDVYMAVAMYYLAGAWKSCDHLDWRKAGTAVKDNLMKLVSTANQWMTKEEFTRLSNLLSYFESDT